MRPWWLVGHLSLTACASAGSGDAIPDAPPSRDAALDAHPPDATMGGCPSPDTCTAATMLGTVSGDTQNQKLTASGSRAAWFRVRVTENNSDIGGLTLRVAAKLTSPAAVNFDAFVYVNAATDVVECATTSGTAMTNGALEETRVEWGETGAANGADDSRHVSIEVRPISGACAADQVWQLEIEGNWD